MSGCAWINASIYGAMGLYSETAARGKEATAIHLRGLLAEKRDIDLGEMRGHHNLAPHLVGGLLEDGLPKRHEELVLVGDAGLHDGPYLAAEDLGRHIRVPHAATLSGYARHGGTQTTHLKETLSSPSICPVT